MKKLLLTLLGVLMTLPLAARDFEYTYEGQTLTYTVLDEDAKTCKTKDGYETQSGFRVYHTAGNTVSGKLIIPEVANGYTVTQIGEYAFCENSDLTSIDIPNSVTLIGEEAFLFCDGLTSINIPDSVTSIGEQAFNSCTGLTSIVIPNKVTSIEKSTFYNCNGLTSVTIPNSVESIGQFAFYKCWGLTSIDIPNSVTSIEQYAFSECYELTSITIPDLLTTINNSVFSECGLKEVHFGSSLTRIEDKAFAGCSDLTSIVIPSGVTSIGNSVFSRCSQLSSITIPGSVTSIGDNAFFYCSALKDLTLEDSTEPIKIGYCQDSTGVEMAPFLYSSLEKLYLGRDLVPMEKDWYSTFSDQGKLNDVTLGRFVTCLPHHIFSYCKGLTSIKIVGSVKTIGASAFSNCTGLTSITFEEGIETIENLAFEECSALTELIFPESLKSIGDKALYNLNSLSAVTFGNRLESIGVSAFEGCSALTELIFPESLKSIGDKALYNLNTLSAVTFGNRLESIGISAFEGCSRLTSLSLPGSLKTIAERAFYNLQCITSLSLDDIETIGSQAFYGNSALKSVILGKNANSINSNAFSECNGLKKSAYPNTMHNPFIYGIYVAYDPEGAEIENGWIYGANKAEIRFAPCTLEGDYTIPDNITAIGKEAFYGCNGLTSLTIPNSVTSIGSSAFRYCSGLTSVTIGNSVESIEPNLFTGCNAIKDLVFADGENAIQFVDNPLSELHLESIYFGRNWSHNQPAAISTSITKFELGNLVTELPDNAFYQCTGLTEINIPDNITSIADSAFEGCTGLTSIAVPGSVKSIGSRAFYNLKTDEALSLNNIETIGSKAFFGNTSLKSVVLGTKAKSIDTDAFSDCSELKKSAYPNTISNPFFYGARVAYNPEGAEIEDGWIYGANKTEILFVPYTVEGDYSIADNITAIGANAFEGCVGLTSVTIPSSVKLIDDKAFYNLSELKSVNFEEGLEIIGKDAFAGCTGLTELNLPNSLKMIDSYAFYNLKGIESLHLGESIEIIGNYAFKGCNGIASIAIPASVRKIGQHAFYELTSITSLSLNNIEYIGSYAFFGNTALKSVILGKNINSIETYAFDGCSGLTKSAYPNTIFNPFNRGICIAYNPEGAEIEDEWIYGADRTQILFAPVTIEGDYVIADNIATIGTSAFEGCTGLTTLTIPGSVKSIGNKAFYNLKSISSLSLNNIEAIGKEAFYGNTELKSVVIGKNVSYVGSDAFSGCSNLVKSAYPKTISDPFNSYGISVPYNPEGAEIEDGWIYGANKTEILFAPYTVEGDYAIADNISAIGANAFEGCSGMLSLTIPSSVKLIDNKSFYNLSNLKSVTFEDGLEIINANVFEGCSALTELNLPNSLTAIGDKAFYNLSGLKSLNFGEAIETIGTSAFEGCTGLTTLIVPGSMKYIGSRAFYNLRSITSLSLNDIETIGSMAFYGNTELKSVVLGKNASSIRSDAFSNCSNLVKSAYPKTIYNPFNSYGISVAYNPEGAEIDDGWIYGRNKTEILFAPYTVEGDYAIADNITAIGANAFVGCSGLTSVSIPSSVTRIEDNAFYNLSGLTSLDLSESVKIIGNSAFEGCSGLTSITVPGSVTSIGDRAFYNLTTNEVLLLNDIETIGLNAFYNNQALRAVIIGKNVRSIGSSAFSCCWNLVKSACPNTIPFNSYGINVAYNPEDAVIEGEWIYNANKTQILYVPYAIEGNYVIADNITAIGVYAFGGCSKLKALTVPSSVDNIYDSAFDGCRSISNLVFEDGDNPIKTSASFSDLPIRDLYIGRNSNMSFSRKTSLKNVVFGDKVTSIPDHMFYNCNKLESVITPTSLQEIGNQAFDWCESLKSFVIPPSVTSVGQYVFGYCSSLVKAAYPNSLNNPFNDGTPICYPKEGSEYKDGFVYGDDKSAIYFAPLTLEGVYTLPASVNTIGENAFIGCSGISDVITLTETPAKIKDNSFEGLYDKAKLTVPRVAINDYMATSWSLFEGFYGDGLENPIRKYSDDLLIYSLNPVDYSAVVIGAKGENVTVPERFTDQTDDSNPVRYYVKGLGYKCMTYVSSVSFNQRANIEFIGDYAFENAPLSSITLPQTVTSIGEGAFMGTKLSCITIPESVTSIEPFTFAYCKYFREINLHDNIESIGESAFAIPKEGYIWTLGAFTMPTSVKYIGKDAFIRQYISNVKITDLKAWCDIEFANINSNPLNKTDNAVWVNDIETTDIVIPEGVKEIKPYAFATKLYARGILKSVTIPNTVKAIGDSAFINNCFTSLTIPASVNYIGSNAFRPGKMSWEKTLIGSAYSYTLEVLNLESLTLEDGTSPITIAPDAFEAILKFDDAISSCKTMYAYNSPTSFYMGREMSSVPRGFKQTVTSLTVGNHIANIPDYFWSNGMLQNLKLGSSIASVGNHAFERNSLNEVILPPSVETIGASAFAFNSGLKSIIMGYKVAAIGENAFNGCPANTVSITAQIPPEAPNSTFSDYSGTLFLQGQDAINAYYDAWTCWDRFNSYAMIEPTRIKYDGPSYLTGKPGAQIQLSATLMPENVTLPHIFWHSTNPEIATVSPDGLLTIVADLGEIKAQSDSWEDTNPNSCKIIAESLYSNGPSVEITVNGEVSGMEGVIYDGDHDGVIDYNYPIEVYTLSGVLVATSTDNLTHGIYIVRQGDVVKKIAVK